MAGPTIDLTVLRRAQQGDPVAREDLIRSLLPFLLQTASAMVGRRLDWHNDEEISVAMLALNAAIDRYDPDRGASFSGFVRTMLRSRLSDYYRSQAPERVQPLSEVEEETAAAADALEASDRWHREREAADRAAEVRAFEQEIARYGVSLEDLLNGHPTHRDTRLAVVRAAWRLAAEPALLAHFRRTGQVPLADLARATGLSRKVLETWRKFLVAATVIAAGDYPMLKPYIDGGEVG